MPVDVVLIFLQPGTDNKEKHCFYFWPQTRLENYHTLGLFCRKAFLRKDPFDLSSNGILVYIPWVYWRVEASPLFGIVDLAYRSIA